MHCASASSSAPESSACWICSGVSSTLSSGVCWLAVSFWGVSSAAGACGSCAASSGVSSSSMAGEFSSSSAGSSAGCTGVSGASTASSGAAGAISAVSGFSVCAGAGSACCAVLSAARSGVAAVLSVTGAGSAAAGLLACGTSAVMWGTTAPTVKVSGCADSRVAAPAPPTARNSAMVSAAMAVTALRRAVPDRSNRFFICCLCLRISRWCSAVLHHRVFAPCPGRARFYSTPPMCL